MQEQDQQSRELSQRHIARRAKKLKLKVVMLHLHCLFMCLLHVSYFTHLYIVFSSFPLCVFSILKKNKICYCSLSVSSIINSCILQFDFSSECMQKWNLCNFFWALAFWPPSIWNERDFMFHFVKIIQRIWTRVFKFAPFVSSVSHLFFMVCF